jgi:leader peptidase (prepilin peptidase)/N-methyltransferase
MEEVLRWLSQPAVLPWIALVFGLCVGSFLNVVIHRLPRMMEREWLEQVPELLEEATGLEGKPETKRVADEVRQLTKGLVAQRYSLVTPRSRCPKCGKGITALQNVPLVSYLWLRGKCAGCGVRISARYPLVELLAGIAAFYSAYRFGLSAQMVAATVFTWCVIALALIDHEKGYLPDDITIALMWFGLLIALLPAFATLGHAVIGAAAGYLVLWTVNTFFRAVRGIEGMGYGDFKMTAAVGAFVGAKGLFLVILLSSTLGLIFGGVQMLAARGGLDLKFKFRFGPYIAMAGVIAIFWGAEIMQSYPFLNPFR